jgi:uncharacterized protein YlxW (UPF0749 family)
MTGADMNKPGTRFIIMIVFILFGIIIAIQIKSSLYAKKVTASDKLSVDTLKAQIAELTEETEQLRAAIDENVVMQNDMIKEYISMQDDDVLVGEWEMIKLHTGLVDVRGPGITIKLDDAPVRRPDTPLKWLIIHDYDVRIILNELKKAGAQAIAVNGERIVPMSEQVCAGPTILINGNRHPVPYYIEAIGDPDVLFESISTSSKVAELVEFNIEVEIKKAKELKIPKFSGADNLDRFISGLEVVAK